MSTNLHPDVASKMVDAKKDKKSETEASLESTRGPAQPNPAPGPKAGKRREAPAKATKRTRG